MGVPAKLTERQIKFAELLVYNEGRLSPAEAAYQAGYKTRPRQAASELRNPKVSPLVVRYIGDLRAEVQEKYGINFEKHISELAQIRNQALEKGAWSAAVNAEVARGKAGGLYVDQKLVMTGNVDNMTPDEIRERLHKILKDNKEIINITPDEIKLDDKTRFKYQEAFESDEMKLELKFRDERQLSQQVEKIFRALQSGSIEKLIKIIRS